MGLLKVFWGSSCRFDNFDLRCREDAAVVEWWAAAESSARGTAALRTLQAKLRDFAAVKTNNLTLVLRMPPGSRKKQRAANPSGNFERDSVRLRKPHNTPRFFANNSLLEVIPGAHLSVYKDEIGMATRQGQ